MKNQKAYFYASKRTSVVVFLLKKEEDMLSPESQFLIIHNTYRQAGVLASL